MRPTRAWRSGRALVAAVLVSVLATAMLVGAGLLSTAPASAATRSVDDAAAGDGADRIQYRGDWATGREARFFDGTEHYSSSVDASAVLRFHGTQVLLHGGVGTGGGIARVSIDGGPAYEVDFHGSADRGDVVLWVSPLLTRGAHRLLLQVTGQRRDDATASFVTLDRFEVRDTRSEHDSTSRALNFVGAWRGTRTRTLDSNTGSVTFRFDGEAAIVYGTSPSRLVGATVDGAAIAGPSGGGVLVSTGPLRKGPHVVRLRLTPGSSVQGADSVRDLALLPERLTGVGAADGWRMNVGNPVLGKNWGTAFDLSAMYDHGVYRMWFSWRPQGSIAYVESLDGVSWTKPRSVLPGVPDTWQTIVNRPSVIIGPDGLYHMWYTGQQGDNSAIGVAVSRDGGSWTRDSRPVLVPDEQWEKPSVMNPSVLWDQRTRQYRMWFSGGTTWEPNAIGLATSADGVHFTRALDKPVLERDSAHRWESDRVAGIQVLTTRTGYLAFYIGYADIDTAAIGTARSVDGVHWTDRASHPILHSTPGTWDCDAVYKPFALYVPATDEWRLWFNGRCKAPEQIGMAVHRGALPQ